MNDFFLSLLLLGSLSSGPEAPFWSTAGCHGLAPESACGTLAVVGVGMDYDSTKALQWHWKTSFGARMDEVSKELVPDQVYAGLRWKALDLDLGIKHRETLCTGADPLLGSLSVTGCSLVWSGNARSMPGYTLTLNPVDIPFTNGRLHLSGSWGDYLTTDQRYVRDALVHNMRLGLGFDISSRLRAVAALDLFGLWGGTNPDSGPNPSGFANYLRMCTGRKGGADATQMDRENTLGDLLGSELLALEYKADGWSLSLRHEIPFEDRSGMKFQNFPDGVNTLHLRMADRDAWVTDAVLEYHSTMSQSGTDERRPATEEEIEKGDPRLYFHENGSVFTIVGGRDDYGNNFEYKTGWTYYGRSIGHPMFFPLGTKDGAWSRDGMTQGVENNRLRAVHMGLSGKLWHRIPYRMMLTWSGNYGRYGVPFDRLDQFCTALQASIPLPGGFSILPGFYADLGKYLPGNVGATLGIRYLL